MNNYSGRDLGLLMLRVGAGGVLFAHGTQKLFGWFGGHGIEATGAAFDGMGFEPGRTNAIAAGLGEAGGGALLALGLATPSASAAVIGTMTVAGSVHAPQGFFAQNGGFELAALFGLTAGAIAFTGPGTFSVDHALGHRLNRPWMRTVAMSAVIPAVASVISRRRKALAAKPAKVPEPTADSPEPVTA
jgi:putative oxidoreductase